MKRYGLILAAALAAAPAWAAPAWVGGTLTGSGRTETLSYPATCTSTTALAIPRRATSLSNALTKYVVTASGITATTHTPDSRTNFASIASLGCDATNALVGGAATWMEYASLSTLSSWTSMSDTASANSLSGGAIYPSPVGGGNYRFAYSYPAGPQVYLYDRLVTASFTQLAVNTPSADDREILLAEVSPTYSCVIAGQYSTGQPYMRGYTSGSSYAYTSQSPEVVMSASSYFYPPFGLSSTACVATVKRASNSHTYIFSAPISGTITNVDAGVIDLIPLGDWDPTGSLRRGWWVNKADGTVRVSNSATTVGSISTNATYDIGSTPLGGSTPLFSIAGLDVDRDGTATDNPVVMMADGSHFAAWGECVDADSDGYPGADSMFCSTHTEDCDDADADINPDATDTPDNGIDEDCSGADATLPAISRPASLTRGFSSTLGGTL